MRKILPILILTFFVSGMFAQKNSDIKGKLKNESEELVGASAILYFAKDSVLTGFNITNENGDFLIPKVAPNNYYIQFNYVGYLQVQKEIKKEDFDGEISFGEIELKPNTDLEAVVVTNAPLEVRKDTIIFDAEAFQTEKNANVEDLLKKLPGIEVDDEGNISAQGEDIQNVLVDGKKFFGNDPKVATRNLPADAVKNIAVFDKKSEKAEFTGIDDGEEEKTLDIQLKDDRKSGYFGNVSAGGGTSETYEGKGMISRFSPNLQLAALGSSNNINNSPFSRRDYFTLRNVTNRGVNLPDLNSESGIRRSTAGGLNVNSTLSEKFEVYSNYFYNQTTNDFSRDIDREYFQSEGDLLYNENTFGKSTTGNHRADVELTFKPNKRNEIKIENQFSFANGDNRGTLQSETQDATQLVNDNETSQNANNKNFNFNSNLFLKHQFAKPGRSIFSEFNVRNNNTDGETFTNSYSNFYRTDSINSFYQLLDVANESVSFGGQMSFTEPTGKNKFLELFYRISNDEEDNNQDFFDIYDDLYVINDGLTNQFGKEQLNHNFGSTYRMILGDHNINFGARYQTSNLNGTTTFSNQEIDNTFNAILPTVWWDFDIKEGTRLDFNYNTYQRIPSVRQLQPAIDNTNPLRIYQGNPNLDASMSHNINARYFTFNRFSFTNFWINTRFTYTNNPIVEAQTFDENLVQTSTPINTNNEYSGDLRFSFSKPIRALRTEFEIDAGLNTTKGQIFINALENEYSRFSHNYGIEFENTNDDKLEVELSGDWNFNKTSYSENEERDQSFLNQRYGIEFDLRAIENWEIGSDFRYNIYSQEAFGDDTTIPLLRGYISRSFAENLGEVRLEMNDLLNRNAGISRSQNLNYSQEEISNVLRRYSMLSVTWNIR